MWRKLGFFNSRCHLLLNSTPNVPRAHTTAPSNQNSHEPPQNNVAKSNLHQGGKRVRPKPTSLPPPGELLVNAEYVRGFERTSSAL